MSSNKWETATLGNVAEIIMGQSPAGETCNEIGNGVPLLNGPTEFGNFHPKPVQYTTDPKKFSKAGDILFCVRGSTTGRMNWADKEYAIGRGLAAIRHKNGKEFQPFLKGIIDYYLPYLLTEATGSTFPNVSSQQLNSLVIEVPPLPTQRRIADILSALDEKIELNRQANATLEAMAQSIFREWFVDFNFPNSTGEMVESELGLIPQGWKVGTIGEIATVIDCLHSKKPERQDYGKIFLQLNNIRNDGLIDLSDVFYISDKDYQKWVSRIEASDGDCIITNVGRVGAVAQIPPGLHAALGRNMTAIRCKAEYPFPTFLISCLLSDFMREEISYKTDSGTILDALNVKNIPLLRFALAPKPILTAFEKTVRPFREQMETNLSQSHVLANIRDLLLPKLMSGEINV